MAKHISTNALSAVIGIQPKEMFEIFENLTWIEKDGASWSLTELGEFNGGVNKVGQKGPYIAWPEDIIDKLASILPY